MSVRVSEFSIKYPERLQAKKSGEDKILLVDDNKESYLVF